MGRTDKDSAKNKRRDIVIKVAGDCFDIFRGGETAYLHISERTLADVLCKKWGYCGQEFDAILNEVKAKGSKTILF